MQRHAEPRITVWLRIRSHVCCAALFFCCSNSCYHCNSC